MTDVLIKNLCIPECCMDCDPDFAYAIRCKAYNENNDFTRQRAENCPLVEIEHSQDGDTISRADAIEAVCGVVIDEFDVSPTRGYEVAEKALSALPSAEPSIKAIKRQIDEHWYLDPPSAEAVQGWIPCSERLPKPWESVMTTICWVGDEYEDDYDIAVGFKKISGDWDLTLADGTGVIKGFLVQAWMPLPTPYKGGDDE